MVKKHIRWPDITQFRNVVKNVQHKSSFIGLDADGNPIYDNRRRAPILSYEGTVKLHGTNAAVCADPTGEMWVQSRDNIITPQKDNAGFAMFVEGNKETFEKIIDDIYVKFDAGHDAIAIFGEWCGKGIQDSVAISELPKMFVVFGIALVDLDGAKTYLTRSQVETIMMGYNTSHPGQIFCIYNYPTYSTTIDFDNPHIIQNVLNDITNGVEAECPVGASMGVKGVGEGVVWRCVDPGYEDSGFWFKVKGAKHSKSKVKTNANVDVERINNIIELSARLAHDGRLEQMHQTVFDTLNGGETDIKKLGDFIKATMHDIFKEEVDVIAASGFTGKEVSGPISKICRDFVMKKLEM